MYREMLNELEALASELSAEELEILAEEVLKGLEVVAQYGSEIMEKSAAEYGRYGFSGIKDQDKALELIREINESDPSNPDERKRFLRLAKDLVITESKNDYEYIEGYDPYKLNNRVIGYYRDKGDNSVANFIENEMKGKLPITIKNTDSIFATREGANHLSNFLLEKYNPPLQKKVDDLLVKDKQLRSGIDVSNKNLERLEQEAKDLKYYNIIKKLKNRGLTMEERLKSKNLSKELEQTSKDAIDAIVQERAWSAWNKALNNSLADKDQLYWFYGY